MNVEGLATILVWGTAAYVGIYHGTHLFMVLGAALEIHRQRQSSPEILRQLAFQSKLMPGISVVIPAYNEQYSIVRTVSSVLAVDCHDLEVIVVNDGSVDQTLGALWEAFDLIPTNDVPESTGIETQIARAVFESRSDPRLKVVDKRNSGKADTLNTGINWSTQQLVCAIDADIVLDRYALTELTMPFILDRNVVATSGMILPSNGESGWLERFQTIEYLRSFSIGRLFFNQLDVHLIISGALGLFRRSALIEAEGYQIQAIGEDMELVVRLHRHLREQGQPCRMVFAARAVCFTEVPSQLGELGRQRTRWHQGLLTTLRLHRKMLFRTRYGKAGLLVFPYFFIFELLSPFTELLGWLLFLTLTLSGRIEERHVLPFVSAAVLLPVAVSMSAILMDALTSNFCLGLKQRWRLITAALLEPFGYHQAMVFYRLRAFSRYYQNIHIRGGWRPPTRMKTTESER